MRTLIYDDLPIDPYFCLLSCTYISSMLLCYLHTIRIYGTTEWTFV